MTLRFDFFSPMPMEPMPTLAALRDAVLMRSDKRMPKWKFRLASDIVTQIQPKPATCTRHNRAGLPWFDCSAVIRDDARAAMLQDRPHDSWQILFKLSIRPGDWLVPPRFPETWNFQATGIGFHRDFPEEDAVAVRERLLAILPMALAELRPGMMLKPACLMCSKVLTDPVSMARWIGPECYGSASSVIPFMMELAR